MPETALIDRFTLRYGNNSDMAKRLRR